MSVRDYLEVFKIQAPQIAEVFPNFIPGSGNKHNSRFYQMIFPTRPMTSLEIKKAFEEDLQKREKS